MNFLTVFITFLFIEGSYLLQQKSSLSQNSLFQTTTGISLCGSINSIPQKTQQREELFGKIARNENQFNNHPAEFRFAETEYALRGLRDDSLLSLGEPDDSLFQGFADSVQQTNIGKLNDVRMAAEQNDLTQAQAKNSNIVPNHIIEENRKTVNGVYLNMLVAETTEIGATEKAMLEPIACQDPLEGGEAVYSARVMLNNMNPCQPSAKMAVNTTNKEEVLPKQMLIQNEKATISKIYPNPNSGNMQLDYQLEHGQIGTLLILDIQGQKIKNYSLQNDRNALKVSDAALKNGIYFYEILIDNEIIRTDKLIIIK